MIDYDGEETTWGFWDPYSLNNVGGNFDERGLNSMQIMTWLMTAYYYTALHLNQFGDIMDKERYLKLKKSSNEYINHWQSLGIKYGYWNNIINQKITIPDDINHSDDELAGVTYMLYFWVKMQAEINGNLTSDWYQYFTSKYVYFDVSWNRTFSFIHTEWQSWYALLDLMANPDKLKDESITQKVCLYV